MGRRKLSEMSLEELTEYENSERYRTGRQDAFDHGNPSTVLEYWDREEPDDAELRTIIRNLLHRWI